MKKLAIATSIAIASAFSALAAGFDGMNLATNRWFAADFTADLATGSAIVANSSTGVTYGAGTWTTVPATGTAVIAADEDAAVGKTMLSLEAPGEELTFTPLPYVSPSGMETFVSELKADALDSDLPVLGPEVQSAFTLFEDGEGNVSAMAWTVSGWTNFTYAASGLTNAWFTLYSDFATVGGVRYVRYSVKPASGSLTVLSDANGTTWFTAATNATVVSSVSLSGIADVRNLSGDSLEEVVAATYNGVAYQTFEAAIAAGIADNWANGNVVLLADAEWSPAATGTYNIDVNGHELTVNGVVYTSEGYVYTVSGFKYYWIGGVSGNWADGSNWSHAANGTAAGSYPSAYSADEAIMASAATITLPAANANVSNLYVNANVSLTGGKIHAKTISGSGKLTMLDGTSFYATEYCTTVSVDVEVPANATVNVSNNGGGKTYGYGVMFTADCALTGSGTVRFDSYRPSNPLYWDASGFSGTVVVVDDNVPRNNTTIRSTTATHEGMSWQVANSGAGDTGLITQEGTYKFGSLSGTVYMANSKSSTSYAYVKDVIMEVGALNGNDVLGGQVARTAGRANDGAYIRKVGSGVLSSSVKGVNGYYIKEGVLNIASDDGLSVKDDYSNPGTDIVFEGGVLRVAAAVTKDVSAYIAIGTSTSPVAFDDEGRDHVWNTALGSSLTGGLTKKGSGTLTLGKTPAYTGTTTIEGGVLLVPQGTTIAELSCTGGKLTVPLAGTEDETEVLTISALADGTTYESVTSAVAVVGETMDVVADGEGGYKVKATRTPQAFTWTGAVDANWATPGNWTIGGAVAGVSPLAIDEVSFPVGDEWMVSLGGTVAASNVVVASGATVALSGGMLKGIYGFGTEADKGGKIVLDGASLESASIAGGSYLSWYGDIEIAGDASVTNYIHCRNLDDSSSTSALRLYGNLTGSGNLCLDRTGHTTKGVYDGRGGVSLYGDNEAFAGVCVIHSGSSTRGPATFCSATAGSGLARWIYPDAVAQNESARAGTSTINGETIRLGTYEGKSYFFACESSHDNNVIEIGGKGVDFACSLSAKCRTNAERGNINTTLRKVGAGTMTFENELGQPYMAKWDLAGGILHLANPNISKFDGGYYGGTKITPEFNFTGGALSLDESCTNQTDESLIDLSAYVKNSTNAIDIIVSEGQSLTWATALAESNTGGLVKKGEGTLTLAAAPEYTGDTYLDGGKLLILKSVNITVKTHDEVKVVRKSYVTIDDKDYIEYRLGDKPAAIIYF